MVRFGLSKWFGVGSAFVGEGFFSLFSKTLGAERPICEKLADPISAGGRKHEEEGSQAASEQNRSRGNSIRLGSQEGERYTVVLATKVHRLGTRIKATFERRWRRLKKNYFHMLLNRHLSQEAKSDREFLKKAREKHHHEYNGKKEPLITIVVLTYHRSKVLVERTIPSILRQTYKNFEVIVAGDCCTDDTEERMREITDPRVTFYNLPYRYKYPKDKEKMRLIQGFGAHAAALERAKGSWVAYMDDDDVADPHHLESLLNFAVSREFEFVFARHRVEKQSGVWIDEPLKAQAPTGYPPFTGNVIPHRTVLYRRYLRLFRPTPDNMRFNIGGDQYTWLRMGRAGVNSGFLPKVVAKKHLRAAYSSIE